MNLENIEIEQQILGAIMVDNDTMYQISELVEPEHFSEALHAELFRTFQSRIRLGRKVIPKTVVQFIDFWPDMMEISPEDYMKSLVADFISRTAIPEYCQTLRDLALRRQVASLSEACAHEAKNPDPDITVDQIVDNIEGKVAEIRSAFHTKERKHTWLDALTQSVDRAGHAYQNPDDIGWPWFTPELEDVVGERLQPGALVGMMADSGGGKTSLAVQQLAYSAEMGIPAIMFSFEQTQAQVADQVLAQRLDLQSRLWRRGQVSEAEFDRVIEYAQTIRTWPMEIHKMYGAKVSDISMRARRFFRSRGPGVMVIDHAKRITPNDGRSNLADQVNQVYGELKNMALEHESAALILMQRKSDGLTRPYPRPVRGDAYGGSGAIENLDACVALWREILWLREQAPNLQSDEARGNNAARQADMEFKAELIGLKARFSEAGVSRMISYKPQFTRFGSVLEKEKSPSLDDVW